MVSVAGLAPARVCLKGRLRELLCIHGRLAECEVVPEVGIAPTSPRLQRGANLTQLLGGACARRSMVVPRGSAPRSAAYRAAALLLSYGTEIGSEGAREGHLPMFL